LSNRTLWIGIVIELLGIVSIIHVPFLANIFNHASLPAWMWYTLLLNALVLYSIEWIRKTILRKLKSLQNGKSSALSLQEVNR
jgi:hypothetical protein